MKELFLAIKEWYEDPVYYHYIGFIINSSSDANLINSVYNDYISKDKNKFIDALKNRVKTALGNIKYNKNDKRIYLSYGQNSKVKNLLLLFNLEYLILQNSGNNTKEKKWFARFPFDIYKAEKWDIEHIDSYTTNELKSVEDQLEWLNTAYKDLKDIVQDEKVLASIEEDIVALNKDFKTDTYKSIKERIRKAAGEIEEGEDSESDEIKNSIGNLTLLNSSINREYKNALFTTKRKRIIENDSRGVFIPLCTKNVFLKYFDEKGTTKTRWSYKNGDYQAYEKRIIETLSEFLIPVATE